MSADGEPGGVLLPCPFCGGEAEIERLGDHRRSTIYQCTSCGCTLETGEEWSHGRLWNTRAAPAKDTPDAATIALCATIVSEEGPQNPEHDWTDYARARASMRDSILKRFATLAKHPTSPEDAA